MEYLDVVDENNNLFEAAQGDMGGCCDSPCYKAVGVHHGVSEIREICLHTHIPQQAHKRSGVFDSLRSFAWG